jgi:antitoxin component YwqK of YwqJK toxin-antitoxin module
MLQKKAVIVFLLFVFCGYSVDCGSKPIDGMTKVYYESGKLMAEKNYKDGKLEGISKQYYESGKLMAVENYKGGKKLSKTCYNELGNPIQCPQE